jgi:hypothetical protein
MEIPDIYNLGGWLLYLLCGFWASHETWKYLEREGHKVSHRTWCALLVGCLGPISALVVKCLKDDGRRP